MPLTASAHPSIGIVADRQGAVFYTDLQHVWKIAAGRKKIAVRDVHTHELFVDTAGNLFGEHQWNDESGEHFYHYLWRLSPDGKFDTVVGNRPAFADADFSLARDPKCNEYFLQPGHHLKPEDSSHIIRRSPSGQETILATGLFRGVSWLHPHSDGSVVYIIANTVYRIGVDSETRVVAKGIAGATPSYTYFGTDPIVYGAWQDDAQNVYVAVFSDQVVKKIDRNGAVSVAYKSAGRWAPTHGVFDSDGRLWVLECSDKNEIRAVRGDASKTGKVQETGATKEQNGRRLTMIWVAIAIIGLMLVYFGLRSIKRRTTV